MTVAPASASRVEQNGAATACSTATTVIPSSGSIAKTSVGAGHAENVLGDVGQDQIGRDRRHLVEPRLAEFALDVILLGECEAAVGLHAGVGGFPRRVGRQHLRHVGFAAAVETSLI